MSWDFLVNILTSNGLQNRGSISGMDRNLFLCHNSQTSSGICQASDALCNGSSFPESKAAGA
jgi:hypothetical protein